MRFRSSGDQYDSTLGLVMDEGVICLRCLLQGELGDDRFDIVQLREPDCLNASSNISCQIA